MDTASILVVDDNAESRLLLQAILKGAGYDVRAAKSGAQALRIYAQKHAKVCVIDVCMPEMDGIALLSELRRIDPNAQVIMLTAHGTIERAVEAMRAGAIDFLSKPVDPDNLLARIKRALEVEALIAENRTLRAEVSHKYDFSALVGHSPQMQEVLALAREAAQRDVTILITGESGVGKEVLARAIHYNSGRRSGPFLAINCAAIAENLMESELFGHERGAFTGADRRKEGLMEQAKIGTLLLDEIGDMPLPAQAKLLRVIDAREMIRVGGTRPIAVGARLIAATNADLHERVRSRQFRDDLFYRLNVFAIHIAPLRDRQDDIVPLARHFLNRLSREVGKELPGFSADAVNCMLAAPWPGNVRELANAIERAVIVSHGNLITTGDFPQGLGNSVSAQPTGSTVPDGSATFDEIERAVLLQAIEKSGRNLSLAARILGMGRGALRYRLGKHGIDPKNP